MSEIYDEDYFIRGKESGKSLYTNYRWIPELTIPMAQTIVKHLGVTDKETILDFGCARGYLVRAFRELGYMAGGVDSSKWAIENCDWNVAPFVSNTIKYPYDIDWIIAKDVLEHIDPNELDIIIYSLMNITRLGIFIVVPLSFIDNKPYVIEEYEKDITHINRFSLSKWISLFLHPKWEINASYRVKGIKDNYYKEDSNWKYGNGFITCKRIKE